MAARSNEDAQFSHFNRHPPCSIRLFAASLANPIVICAVRLSTKKNMMRHEMLIANIFCTHVIFGTVERLAHVRTPFRRGSRVEERRERDSEVVLWVVKPAWSFGSCIGKLGMLLIEPLEGEMHARDGVDVLVDRRRGVGEGGNRGGMDYDGDFNGGIWESPFCCEELSCQLGLLGQTNFCLFYKLPLLSFHHTVVVLPVFPNLVENPLFLEYSCCTLNAIGGFEKCPRELYPPEQAASRTRLR